jgi:hypothetical protein
MTATTSKWTQDQIEAHLKVNIKDSYGGAIVCAALFKKLYGCFPKIGLSGYQAEAAESIIEVLPDGKPYQLSFPFLESETA